MCYASLHFLYIQICPIFLSKVFLDNLLPFFWDCPKISIKCSSAGRWHRNITISCTGGNRNSIPNIPAFQFSALPEQTWGCSPCPVTRPGVPQVCYPDGSSEPLLRGRQRAEPWLCCSWTSPENCEGHCRTVCKTPCRDNTEKSLPHINIKFCNIMYSLESIALFLVCNQLKEALRLSVRFIDE